MNLNSENDNDNFQIANLVASCLAIFGCSIIIAFYIFNKNIRNLSTRLIMYLTISNVIFAVSNLISYILTNEDLLRENEISKLCSYIGVAQELSSTSAFSFVSGICFYIYQMNCKRIYWDIKKELKLIIIVAIFSIIMAIS